MWIGDCDTNAFVCQRNRETIPALLTYEEILKKYEDMMLIQYAKMLDDRGEDHGLNRYR